MKTSIIIPVYNEEKTIERILEKVLASPIKKEVIIVNDGSTDKTKEVLENFKRKEVKVIFHSKNLGKGSAIRTALEYVQGEIALVQDADLEYDPGDYQKLIKPILDKEVKVVYGSRWLRKKKVKPSIFYFGTQLLTWITNLLYGTKISDESCGYKVFDTRLLKSLSLESKRFEFCPEVTAKVAKKGIRIIEVPIHYTPRSISQGKKIKWGDGVVALFTLLKYRFDWAKIGLPLFLVWAIFILAFYLRILLCRGGICLSSPLR